MSQRFDWRSDDDGEWEVEDASDRPAKSTRTQRHRWLLVGTIAFLILSASLLSFRQVGRYLDETALEADQEILASNNLVLTAARDVDPEILASLLSGRDLIWAAGQLELLEAGLMFDRKPFGIEWLSGQLPISEVTVAPGIDRADVITYLKYTLASGPGKSETITLKHLLHYRRSNDGWLLSPQTKEYWGRAISEEGYYLNITFPEGDSIIRKRLAIDLEGLLAALCHLDHVDACQLDFPFQLKLVTDPTSINQFGDPNSRLTSTLALELPTPSIIGLPEDETGYQALYRAYGERVVSAVVAEQIGWQCCSQVLIYQALLDQQLSRLGLIPSPLTVDHYRQALNEPLVFSDLIWAEWHPTRERMGTREDIFAHLLIEYVVSEWFSGPLIDLQRNLLIDCTFHDYLALSIRNLELQAFEDGWLPFLNRRIDSLENQDA